VWSPGEEVAKLAYFGLYALQHRGQESAGIAVSDGNRIVVYKDMGLVAQVFDEAALSTLREVPPLVFAGEVDSVSGPAHATAGLLATATPTPNATANAPTRPT